MNPVTYTMLDLKGLDLASVRGQSYSGLYNSIYAAMNRCQEIILCNWFVASILIPPTYCLLEIDEANVISINNKVFIYPDDTIEIPDMGINPRILELSITQNGEYSVPVNYDGFNPVNVNVQQPLEEISITENGEYLPSEGYYGIGKATVSIPDNVPILTRAEWDALTTSQKQSYGLLAIQDSSSGFLRGDFVDGASYKTLNILQSGAGTSSATFTVSAGGDYLLYVIGLNSEASTYQLNISVTKNGDALTGETMLFNSYVSSGSNRRNYRVMYFSIQANVGDIIQINLANYSNYSSLVYALCDSQFTEIDKALSAADATCSGSNDTSGAVLYGTFNSNSGGTINGSLYTAGTTITTANPGTNYKSAYIFFLT